MLLLSLLIHSHVVGGARSILTLRRHWWRGRLSRLDSNPSAFPVPIQKSECLKPVETGGNERVLTSSIPKTQCGVLGKICPATPMLEDKMLSAV